MSTRCCVKVVKKFNDDNVKEVMIYHHHDGYPEGVGADLVNRSKEKWDKYANGWDIDLIVNDLVKDTDEEYEITCYNHVDIEYLYTIDCDNKDIKCNAARWDMQEKDGEYISQSIIEEEVAIPGYKEKKEGEPDPAFETIQALGHKIEKEENGYNIEILNAPHDGTYFIHITDKHNVVSELENVQTVERFLQLMKMSMLEYI